jgi:hypothetical protein
MSKRRLLCQCPRRFVHGLALDEQRGAASLRHRWMRTLSDIQWGPAASSFRRPAACSLLTRVQRDGRHFRSAMLYPGRSEHPPGRQRAMKRGKEEADRPVQQPSVRLDHSTHGDSIKADQRQYSQTCIAHQESTIGCVLVRRAVN